MNYSKEISKKALEIGAIKLNVEEPFQWASGYRMPIYNDNRMLLFFPEARALVTEGFEQIIDDYNVNFDIIAGTSTAGIAPGERLADALNKPFVYVRDKPKGHGLKNQIEGIDAESNLNNAEVLLIEDLISTGGSSVKAVQAIRDANGKCNWCLSIFTYSLDTPTKMFAGEVPYDKEGIMKLTTPCNTQSILNYDSLLETAVEQNYLDKEQVHILKEWREDPFSWGEKKGFPRVLK